MSKKKYKKGELIWSLEELDSQEFIFFMGKVYHKGFWKSWQYRWVTERLNNGQLFKAERISKPVYVCYEENNHELAMECGAITDLTVVKTADKAFEWFERRVNSGCEDGFVIDRDDETVTEENTLNTRLVKKRIADGFVSLTMFRSYQENWDESYAICVYEQEVE